MAKVTFDGLTFLAALEPDGEGGHWLQIDPASGFEAGDALSLTLEPTDEWQEPELPSDVEESFAADAEVLERWQDVTAKARWDWIRWIRSAKQQTTRARRIETACSMLKEGKRRPCCFNRSLCTIPEISKSGVLSG